MRIAITADWHARGKDMPEFSAQLKALEKYVCSHEIGCLAIAGDVFDCSTIYDKHASTGAISYAVIKPLINISELGKVPVVVIPGGHDQSGVGSADALYVLEGMPNVTVIHTAQEWQKDDVGFLCLPWSWDSNARPDDVLMRLVEARRSEHTILLAHGEIIGKKMNDSFCCEAKPGKWQFSRKLVECLPVSHIAFGHFHMRQPLFVGALRQTDFGDGGNPAGLEIYDTETRETEWIELDAAPTYRTVEVSNPNLMPGKRTNEHLRIRYVGTQPIDPSVIAELERNEDTQLEVIVPRQERIQRAEVPAGIADDPHGLIGLWAGTQNPPVEATPLNQMYDRVHADARKEV